MSKIDSSRCTIRLQSSEEVAIRDKDVGSVIGIPWHGKDVTVQPNSSYETLCKIRNIFRQADCRAVLTMSHVEAVLKKEYHSKMTNEEIAAFKVAVVMFTMNNLLGNEGNSTTLPLGLLIYLTDPSEIHLYNWGLLVRRYLISSAHLVT